MTAPAAQVAGLFSLAGKRALVTGSSQGLGRAMAEALAGAGADVVCGGFVPGDARDTVASIEALGRRAWEVAADVADRDALLHLADRAESAAGGAIDILVNNAGTIKRKAAVEHTFDDWDTVIRTNLDSVFVLSQRIGRTMVERGAGKIVNVASLLSFSGGITVPGYTASKHAVAGLTKAFANEWAQSGVNVNAIAPGYMQTENTRPLREDKARTATITARIPAARWGTPEDLAGAVVFLSSRASDYVNGHVLVVDGGWMAR
ncbi:MAG: 2-dehydro-3-deoxy-D-gluconate 5-dehydrogenase KduD [Gemmatimonadaceae bacterium]